MCQIFVYVRQNAMAVCDKINQFSLLAYSYLYVFKFQFIETEHKSHYIIFSTNICMSIYELLCVSWTLLYVFVFIFNMHFYNKFTNENFL